MYDRNNCEVNIDFDKVQSSILAEMQNLVNKCLNSTDSGSDNSDSESSESENSGSENSDCESSDTDLDSDGPVVKSTQINK